VLVRAAGRVELVAGGLESTIAYDPATGRELWRGPGVKNNPIPSPLVLDDIVIVSAGYPDKLTIAMRAGGTGDITGTPRVLWTYAKGSAYVPSPIHYDGLAYLITDKGLLTALDARTGEVKYEGGRVPVPATFTASPVAFGGKLLITSEDGDTYVVKAGPVHEILRTNALGEPVYASPALSQGRVFIRGEKHLYAIGAK
jgi:outer membrane protein assembly factor BamB